VQCFSPDADQASVCDHAAKAVVSGETRNMLAESSRIARAGQCQDLALANAADFDALVIPGGFGLAKNLCTWATQGIHAEVRPDVANFVKAFFDAGKPVGAICIAPALVALCLHQQQRKATLTLGDASHQAAMEQLGHGYQVVPSSKEIVIDEALKLVTTSAYMFGDARLSDVWIGIERCVTEVLRRV
jgi:enhancing lycopene biosynthesis protein 2